MRNKHFIDTNILVYANDSSDKAKQEICKHIILQGIQKQNIAVSVQVLGEFYVTVTRKIKKQMDPELAKKEILLLRAIEIVEIDYHSVIQAVNHLRKYQLSYWDALILASALKSGCNQIYTEDLNHGQNIEGIRIINPFL